MAGMQGTIDSAGYSDWTGNNTITLNVYGTSGLKSKGKVVLNQDYLPGATSDVYYSDPQDAQDIATFIYQIFQGLNASDLTPLNLAANSSIDQIRDYITSSTAYTRGEVQHWSSSCRIGFCVDANTTVIGTKNIHVVDASIVMPLSVNPQFGVMIAAERASQLILAMNNTFANPPSGTLLGLNSTSGAVTNGTNGSGSSGISGGSGGHKSLGVSMGRAMDMRALVVPVAALLAVKLL
jgi:cellobiose dehydrogenase (acceptor)